MKTSIANIVGFVKRHQDRLWRGFVLVLIAWSGFNVGIISARKGAIPAQEATLFQSRTSIVSQTPVPAGQGSQTTVRLDKSDVRVVVSKGSSSKKYHYSWCSSGQRIKEPNRLWFPTAQAAEAAGYTLAGNCSE